mgnify:CR=1 FL=1
MKEILLVEGDIDFELILTENLEKDCKIISFDYFSHKSLNERKIPHKKIEEFFEKTDVEEIENFSLKLATNWYNDKNIQQNLIFENLNLGTLIENELSSYFLKIIKRVYGIKKVLELENPDKIFSYSLSDYLKIFEKKENLELISFKDSIDTELFFDKIRIPINLRFKKMRIKISRKNYFYLKKNIENFLYNLVNIKPKKKDLIEKESILLLDFHTKMYKDFFQSFVNPKYNILIFNQRKPVIWDLESLKIIKNSKCKVITRYDFENKEITKIIKKERKKMNENIQLILKNEKVLKDIFSFDGESFWNIIKKEFSEIIIERFIESVERLCLLKNMFEKIKIKHIVDWAHIGMEEKEISHFAKFDNIPVSCLQHGIMTLNPLFEKYHPIMPVLPSNNSRMLVWGKTMESYLLKHDVDKNKIKIVGSPRHDIYFKNDLTIKNSRNILITSNLFFHHNFNGIHTDTFEKYTIFLEKILKNLKSRQDKTPIIKLHMSEQFDIKPIIEKIDPNIPIYQDEDILPLIKSCDSMISLNYSTVLLDALILKKPTIVILPEKQNFEEEDIIKQEAVLPISELSDVESKLNNFLDNENFRNLLVENGERFIDNYFSYQQKSSKYLSEILLE